MAHRALQETAAGPGLWQGALAVSAGPALLVHGGAWDIPDSEVADHLEGLHLALARGRRLLEKGARALDVVADVVAVLEAHGAFDAGRGAVLDRDGGVQLDAGIMDGETGAWGAVANVRHLAHPVRVARHLLDGDAQACLLVAEGAERYAAEHGFPFVETGALVVPREVARYERLQAEASFHTSEAFAGGPRPPDGSSGEADRPSDESAQASNSGPRGTVGAVARDAEGRLAAATSTGGTPYARAGRVGDSPIPGSGFYADLGAAASATGWGEAIAAVQLGARAAWHMEAGASPVEAAVEALAYMGRRARWPGAADPTGGLLLVSPHAAGWAFSTPRMARGAWWPGAEPIVLLDPPHKDEVARR